MGLKNAENTKLPYSNVPWSERPLLNKTRLQTRSLFIYARRKAKAWHSDSNEHVGNVNKSNSEATQQDPTTDILDLQNIPPSYDALHCDHNAGLTATSTIHDHNCIHNAGLTASSRPCPRLHPQWKTNNYLHHPWPRLHPQDHDCIHNAGPTTTSRPCPRSFWQCAPLKQHLFGACKEKTIAR